MKHETARIDHDTVVIVEMDADEPRMKELGANRVLFDARLVFVQFITGPYTGREGMIERYKLSPFPKRD